MMMRKRIVLLSVVFILMSVYLFDQMFWGKLSDTERGQYTTEAQRICLIQKDILPPHDFSSDGCSLWPNGTWTECCLKHDYIYWCGGDTSIRVRADRELRDCVNEIIPLVGSVMYPGVRVGGASILPTSFRWGYGYSWPEH